MSRCYELTIRLTEHNEDKVEAIVEAVKSLGYAANVDSYGGTKGITFGDDHGRPPEILFDSETVNLHGGTTEEDAARAIAEAIWTANGAWCTPQVGMRDLDADCPQYVWGEDAYDEWMKDQPRSRSK